MRNVSSSDDIETTPMFDPLRSQSDGVDVLTQPAIKNRTTHTSKAISIVKLSAFAS
jgi:hypothetical protein